MKKYIVSNPEIMGGKPVIAGTRIPVDQILFLLKEGFTVEAIHEEYPHVATKVLQLVVDRAAELINNNASKFL